MYSVEKQVWYRLSFFCVMWPEIVKLGYYNCRTGIVLRYIKCSFQSLRGRKMTLSKLFLYNILVHTNLLNMPNSQSKIFFSINLFLFIIMTTFLFSLMSLIPYHVFQFGTHLQLTSTLVNTIYLMFGAPLPVSPNLQSIQCFA